MPSNNSPSSASGVLPVLSSFFWSILWLFSLGMLLITYVLRWWPGDRLLIVRLVNYAMPWMLIILVPSLILSGLTNRKWLMLSLVLSTLFICVVYFPLFININHADSKSLFTLKVMSYNVWSHNRDVTATARVIEQAQPDILMLQELSREQAGQISALLSGTFPEDRRFIVYDPKTLLATISRYPLTAEQVKVKSPMQKSTVQTPSGPVTIYNAHFLRTVLRRRHNWQRLHDRIMQVMTEEIAQVTGPVILGGDFNITDQTETYRKVCKQLKNAHWEAGQGFGFSFPSPTRKWKGIIALPPMVRIDHIFYNDQLEAVRAATLPDGGGSDHLPIIAEFTRPSRQGQPVADKYQH